jgi:acetate kinase
MAVTWRRQRPIDPSVLAGIEQWSSLAPLHQPLNLAGIKAARQVLPQATHVACFDTGFHRLMPRNAALLAIPASLRSLGIRRYGFHGLSFESVLDQLTGDGVPVTSERIVVAHLGGGSSLCAIANGASVDTTMGVTPLSGVPMTTRCGDLDPGALLFLLRSGAVDAKQLEALLYEQSGLKGLTGTSGDMRELLEARKTCAESEEAVGFYCYQIRKNIGALAASMEGIDRIVFTGGIGANAPVVRAAVCSGLKYLGVDLLDAANAANARVVSSHGSRVQVNTIQTDEEAVIARLVLRHYETTFT